MPKYLNEASYPIFYGDSTFISGKVIETLDVINNQAFIFSTTGETYLIDGTNDVLRLRFNSENTWTDVTLTHGAVQTAADVAADINTAYGYTIAYDEGGRLKIVAPRRNNELSSVWLAYTGGTANTTLGLVGRDHNPAHLVAKNVFINSTKTETYNITSSNNIFIFKFNNEDWTIVTLTTGAARTAQEISDDINTAYRSATGKFETVAEAVELVSGSGVTQLKLISPITNVYKSSIFIKSLGNTALSVLGFDGDDNLPLIINGYPQLNQLDILPLFNPLTSYTVFNFSGAGLTTFYTNSGVIQFDFIRVSGAGVNIYIEDLNNVPPINLIAGEKFTITHKLPRINKFIIQSLGIGSLTILESN